MVEILVVIAVVKAFKDMAGSKGLNKSLWAWIGGLSYYVPVLIFGFLILPILFENGIIPVQSEGAATIIAILLNLVMGIVCCGSAYLYLKSRSSVTASSDPTIIDQI